MWLLFAARLRVVVRRSRALVALLALLQVGAGWKAMLYDDLEDMQDVLTPRLDQLPSPRLDSQQWLDVASQQPV